MSTCKSCGEDVTWATTRLGKKIPLDSITPVFKIIRDVDRIANRMETWAERVSGLAVCHFDVCGRRKKKAAESQGG